MAVGRPECGRAVSDGGPGVTQHRRAVKVQRAVAILVVTVHVR